MHEKFKEHVSEERKMGVLKNHMLDFYTPRLSANISIRYENYFFSRYHLTSEPFDAPRSTGLTKIGIGKRRG